jgi:hypothetical protein
VPDSDEDAGGDGGSDCDEDALDDKDERMGTVSSTVRDYFCITPESDPKRNLEETTSRMKRRLEKRREQQRTAFSMQESPVSSSVLVAGDLLVDPIVSGRKKQAFKKPILEPSTFVLEDELDTVAWTLVTRRRSPNTRPMIVGARDSRFPNLHDTADRHTGFRGSTTPKMGHTGLREISAGFGLRGIFGFVWRHSCRYSPRVPPRDDQGDRRRPGAVEMAHRAGGGRGDAAGQGGGPRAFPSWR